MQSRDSQGTDLRRHFRWPMEARVRVTSPVDAFGLASDLSAGGLRARLNRELAVGMRCDVSVEASAENVVRHRARVVWTAPHLDGCETGLRFLA